MSKPKLHDSLNIRLGHYDSSHFEAASILDTKLGTMVTEYREFEVEFRPETELCGTHEWTRQVRCPACGQTLSVQVTQRTAWVIQPGDLDSEPMTATREKIRALIRTREKGQKYLEHGFVFLLGAALFIGIAAMINNSDTGLLIATGVYPFLFVIGEVWFLRWAKDREFSNLFVLFASEVDKFICEQPNAKNIITQLMITDHGVDSHVILTLGKNSRKMGFEDLMCMYGLSGVPFH